MMIVNINKQGVHILPSNDDLKLTVIGEGMSGFMLSNYLIDLSLWEGFLLVMRWFERSIVDVL